MSERERERVNIFFSLSVILGKRKKKYKIHREIVTRSMAPPFLLFSPFVQKSKYSLLSITRGERAAVVVDGLVLVVVHMMAKKEEEY